MENSTEEAEKYLKSAEIRILGANPRGTDNGNYTLIATATKEEGRQKHVRLLRIGKSIVDKLKEEAEKSADDCEILKRNLRRIEAYMLPVEQIERQASR